MSKFMLNLYDRYPVFLADLVVDQEQERAFFDVITGSQKPKQAPRIERAFQETLQTAERRA